MQIHMFSQFLLVSLLVFTFNQGIYGQDAGPDKEKDLKEKIDKIKESGEKDKKIGADKDFSGPLTDEKKDEIREIVKEILESAEGDKKIAAGDKETPKPDATTAKPTNVQPNTFQKIVMILKDYKGTTKKTFASIRDLLKNGLKGSSRKSLVNRIVEAVSKIPDLPLNKPIFVAIDADDGVKILTDPEEIKKYLKGVEKDADKKEDDDEESDEFESFLEEYLA